MTPERLEFLAEAWGGDLRRWPASERTAAQVLFEQDAGARRLLERAGELDVLLDTHAVTAPDERLSEAVLAGAPEGRARHLSGIRHPQPPRRWWWSSAGVAGVGLAGSAFGAIAVAMVLSGAWVPTALKPTPSSPINYGGWAVTAFDAGNTFDGSEE